LIKPVITGEWRNLWKQWGIITRRGWWAMYTDL
jgi:hypothetical protein